MFLAALDDLFQQRAQVWQKLLSDPADSRSPAERLIDYEAKHMGEFGFYRIVFTALGETDDPDVRAALVRMYRQFQRLLRKQIEAYRNRETTESRLPADMAAWALIGLATVSNISRELDLLKPRQRERMFAAVAEHLAMGAKR